MMAANQGARVPLGTPTWSPLAPRHGAGDGASPFPAPGRAMPPPVPAAPSACPPLSPPSESSPPVHDLVHHQEGPLHVVQQPALLYLLPASGRRRGHRLGSRVLGPGPPPSQSSAGPVSPLPGVSRDRGSHPRWVPPPRALPQCPHPRRRGLGGPAPGSHRRRWPRASRRQASTADSISCGRRGGHQRGCGGVPGAVGGPQGCPPPPLPRSPGSPPPRRRRGRRCCCRRW